MRTAHRLHLKTLLVIAAAFAGGCTDAAPEAPELPEWRLSPSPTLQIGLVDGDERYLFGSVVGVLPLPGDRLLVADAQVPKLRIYDDRGVHVADIGTGPGSGPGEFQRIARVFPFRGDSVVAYDQGTARVVVVAQDGSIGRTDPIEIDFQHYPDSQIVLANAEFVGAFDDGRLAFLGPERIPLDAEESARGVRQITAFSPGSGSSESLTSAEGLLHRVAPPSLYTFSQTTSARARGERLLIGNGADPAIRVINLGSGAERQIRTPAAPVTVTDEILRSHEAAVARILAERGIRRERPATRAERPHTEVLPHYAGFLSTAEGEIWVEQFRTAAQQEEDRTYTILSADGEQQARITVPAKLRILEVAGGRVYGTERDANEVHYVSVYEVLTP